MIVSIMGLLLALNTWKVAIAEHELYASLRFRGQPNKNLILPNLLSILLLPPGQRSTGDLLARSYLILITIHPRLQVDLLLDGLNPRKQFLVHLENSLQFVKDLLIIQEN